MITIAWDVDDVLNDLMRLWFVREWLPYNRDSSLTCEDIVENPPHQLLGLSEVEYLSSLDNFRLSKVAQQMQPVPEVFSWFKEYGGRFRHIALTARSLQTVPTASSWVFQYFGCWIRSFHFIPAKRKGQSIPEYDQTKGDFLRWFGKVDILIDDSDLNINLAKAEGIKGILMPRPWNGERKVPICEILKELR